MTITRALRQWATAGVALVVLTACADGIAGVAEPVPAASRSGATPVPITESRSSGTTPPDSTAPDPTPQETTPPVTTEQQTGAAPTIGSTVSSAVPTTPVPTTPVRTTSRTTSQSSRSAGPTAATGKDVTARLTESGAIVVSRGTPKITIDVFEEPYCFPCAQFNQRYHRQLDAAVADGTIALRLRVVTFLDAKSPSGDYSTRAFSALLAVAGIDGDRPGVFLAFQNALFDPDTQPLESAGEDLTDAQISALAEKAGVSRTAIAAFGTAAVGNIAVRASAENQAALAKLGQGSVPTVAANGKLLDHQKPDWLTRALDG